MRLIGLFQIILPYICSETLAQSFKIVNTIEVPERMWWVNWYLDGRILLQKVNPEQQTVGWKDHPDYFYREKEKFEFDSFFLKMIHDEKK